MATHSGILAWEIPWAVEPGGLQSLQSQSWTHTCVLDRAAGIFLTDTNGVYTPSRDSCAIGVIEIILPVSFGPGVQCLEPCEFEIMHGDYRMPLDSCEHLPNSSEEHRSIKWCLFKKERDALLLAAQVTLPGSLMDMPVVLVRV